MKKYLLTFFLIFTSFFYLGADIANAQEQTFNYKTDAKVSTQIEQFLCAPSKPDPKSQEILRLGVDQNQAAFNNQNSGDLYNCINRLYRFAIAIGSAVAVFMVVVAGYVYMSAEGNEESVTKAKDILVSSVTGLIILFVGYILLRAINPDLIKFQRIQPPSVTLESTSLKDWQGSMNIEGSGGGDAKVIGTEGPAGCNNCDDYTKFGLNGNSSQKSGKNTFLDKSLIQKLQTAKATFPNFIINEAFPPTVNHASPCHFNGTCVDIGITNSNSAGQIDNLCNALQSTGLRILNEYGVHKDYQFQHCGAARVFQTTTGGHLHVSL